jgi:hypothetical protein
MGARGLHDLPTELQLNIYSYLLPSSVIIPFKGPDCSKRHRPHVKIALKAVSALLQVHSTCYKNVIVQLYALSTFMLFSAADAARWIKMIGQHNAASIQTIQLHWVEAGSIRERRQQMEDYISIFPHLPDIQNIIFVGLGPFFSTYKDGSCYWKLEALKLAKSIVKQMPWLANVYSSSDPRRNETSVCFEARGRTYKKFVSFRCHGTQRQRLSKS